MADEKDKVGTPGEFGFRDDDRNTPYGRPSRSGRLGFLIVAAILVAAVLLFTFSQRSATPPSAVAPGEAVRPR